MMLIQKPMLMAAIVVIAASVAPTVPVTASHNEDNGGHIFMPTPFPKGFGPAFGDAGASSFENLYGFWVWFDSYGTVTSITKAPMDTPYDIDFYWYGYYNDFYDWGLIGSCTTAGGEESCPPPTSHPTYGRVYADQLFVTAAYGTNLNVTLGFGWG